MKDQKSQTGFYSGLKASEIADSLISDLEKAFKGNDKISGVHIIVVQQGEDKQSAEERYRKACEIRTGDALIFIDCVSNARASEVAPRTKEPLENLKKEENFVVQDLP